jgi:tetratricopeptide (TPR) repeat protein
LTAEFTAVCRNNIMNRKKKRQIISIILFLWTIPIFAQDQEQKPEESSSSEKEVEIVKVTKKIEPIFPKRDSSLIFVEGENAVSTNFNREPILNYSCSGFRTLQLNQTNDLHNEASYNSDYVFYVEEDGIYELWYGGTPPGNRDNSLVSFASPFRYTLDGIYGNDVYREDVKVVEEYAPSYYWNQVKEMPLSAGEHRIKFEIQNKRSLDNRYYFYLDNFFLIRKENGKRAVLEETPDVFPTDMDNRSIDSPFASFEEYQLLIRENPEELVNYLVIARMYSLAGDYLNALKYLRRADFLSPDNPEIMLFIAKNLIWKGSMVEGIDMYKRLLEIVPERIDLWTEAGKIAAWAGLYNDSEELLEGGLDNLPNDLNLLTNLGITKLWMGEANKAEQLFEQAVKLAGNDLQSNRELAQIYRVNGYPGRAVSIYRSLINSNPAELQLYFDLEETYIENDQRDRVKEVRELTEQTFIGGEEFAKVTGTFYESQSMKEKVIADYEEQLAGDPENLDLRRVLAEIYFWNNYRKKAIAEYRNILTSYTYTNMVETERKLMPFLELLDRSYALSHYMKTVPQEISKNQKNISSLLSSYRKAQADLELLKKKNNDLESKGKPFDRSDETIIEELIKELEEELSNTIYSAETFVEKFNILDSQFKEEKENLAGLMEDEEASAKAYELLMEGTKWEWNRRYMLTELNDAKKDGVILANYVLGKIQMFEGNPKAALNEFAPLIEGDFILDPAPFALYESKIWLGEEEGREELYSDFTNRIEKTTDYAYYLNDYMNFLYSGEESSFNYFMGEPEDRIKAVNESYKEILNRTDELNISTRESIKIIHAVLGSNLERGFYNLAQETYLLRNELGDFYFNQKMYPRGIAQYEQVLAVDPWNLSAKFKLAQVYHFNGDWVGALKNYSEVYEEDPLYNNVASFYNELSREFADGVNISVSLFSDPSSLKYDFHGDYTVNFTPTLAMKTDIDMLFDRVYKAYDGTNPTDGVSLFLNSAALSFPISRKGLKLTPGAGVYFKTDLVDGDGRNAGGEPILWNTDFGLFNYTDFYFHGGAEGQFDLNPFSLRGGYDFNWLTETIQRGSDLNYHRAFADIGYTFPLDIIMQVGGKGDFISDGNLLWQVSALGTHRLQLKREPAMYLNWGLDFSLEDGLRNSDNYWVPEMSLQTGLNLEYEVEFESTPNSTIGEKIWFNSDFTSSGENTIKGFAFEAGNSLSYSKRDYTVFLNISGSMTTQLDPVPTEKGYWSLTIEMGVSALFPEYLIP